MALTLCEDIGTSRSLSVYLLLSNGEYQQYVDLDFDPSRYDSAQKCADDYLVTRILSKHRHMPLAVDRRRVALDGFRAAEEVCAQTNARFSRFYEGVLPDADVLSSVLNAQRYVGTILGRLSRSELDFVEENMRFGPGATTSLSGVVTLGKKFSSREINATSRILPYWLFCRPKGWATSPRIRIRGSSKVAVVPKNCKTDRTICIEPDLNIFVQLGIGAAIRRRLRNFGLDLNTQGKNQKLAQKASVDDSLCTMDLSSASDLISREVVWFLLPYDWADLLHFARTDQYELDGENKTFHKWSSMGNGYTFELESLIFYAVLLGCGEELGFDGGDCTAYGDDLIFPSNWLDLVTRTLDFLGFKVNREKTFGKGPFRESCGTDWFRGVNVRPIFWKGLDNDQTGLWYSYANGLRRWANRRNGGWSCDARCLRTWVRLFRAVPRWERHRIPEGYGDVGFISNWDEASPSIHRMNGWGTYSFCYRAVRPKRRLVDMDGALVSALHRPSDFAMGVEPLRGRFSKPLTRRGHTLVWPDQGPWL